MELMGLIEHMDLMEHLELINLNNHRKQKLLSMLAERVKQLGKIRFKASS
jgi:hypothetical protein